MKAANKMCYRRNHLLDLETCGLNHLLNQEALSIVLGNVASWPLCMITKDGSSVVLPVTITKGVGEEGVVFGGWSC